MKNKKAVINFEYIYYRNRSFIKIALSLEMLVTYSALVQTELEKLSVIATRLATPISLLPRNVSNLNLEQFQLGKPNHVNSS